MPKEKSMLLRATFFLLPLIAFAQAPPPEVDQALRARVNEFFQDHVDGDFRKAYNLVAEDTKEFYFSAQKNKLNSFQIDSIDYSDDFTRADVQLTCQRMWKLSAQFKDVLVTVPMRTTWKLEDGKWFYSHDPRAETLFPGTESKTPQAANAGDVVETKPPDLSEKGLAARTATILNQSSVDKSQVVLASDKASSDQVVFHNGYPGWVQVAVDPGPKVAGFSASVDKINLNSGEEAVLKISYDPNDAPAPATRVVKLTVLPFNRTFSIAVGFEATKKK
jgi:hypothetical protein